MAARHDLIGIKQTLRLEWLQRTTGLLLAGLDPKAIREELHDWLADRMGSGAGGGGGGGGGVGGGGGGGGGGGTSNNKEGDVANKRESDQENEGGPWAVVNLDGDIDSDKQGAANPEGQRSGLGGRGAASRTQVVNMLMKIWVGVEPDLADYRDACLAYLRAHPAAALAVHWGMAGAVYPFWFNTARQIGRLLALQDQVTQAQITGRLKEQYGDRQTVSRYGRYAIRSMIAWGVIRDSSAKGCYERVTPVRLRDPALGKLLVEAALHARPEAKASLSAVLNSPAFFPFQLPPFSGDLISRQSNRIEVVRYGLDEELLRLPGRAMS